MSFAAVAVAVVVAGAAYYTTEQQNDANEEAQKEARRAAREKLSADRKADYENRKKDEFSSTVGKGIGDIGVLSTQVDNNLSSTYNNDLKL